MIQIGNLETSKDHALVALERNNFKSKGKLKVEEKNPTWDSEDEGSYSTNKGLNYKNKGNKKGISKCTY